MTKPAHPVLSPLAPLTAALVACGLLWTPYLIAEQPAESANEAPVDLGGFGSADPEQESDHPEPGQVVFRADQGESRIMEHWDQYDWSFEATGDGEFRVILRYQLLATSLGIQFHHPDSNTRLRTLLKHTGPDQWATVELGEIPLSGPGSTQFSIYTPTLDNRDSFRIEEVRWIPNPGAPDPAVTENTDITEP